MSSAESRLGSLDSIVRSVKRFCKGELCCLRHRRRVSALCWLYKIYHRVDNPMNEYLDHFVAALNFRTSAALCEFTLAISRCRTEQFSRSFLPAVARLWSLLPSGAFSGGTLSFSENALNLCLLRA